MRWRSRQAQFQSGDQGAHFAVALLHNFPPATPESRLGETVGRYAPSKPTYRTTNWTEYNTALKVRGSLLIWPDQNMCPLSWQSMIQSRAAGDEVLRDSQPCLDRPDPVHAQ
ncbi:hypothetical protein GQ37_022300 [Janthinobacterium sp. BJB1]|nr:hypothetical protein GQ37_022300 [Janthinobacterium sp. BJB1]